MKGLSLSTGLRYEARTFTVSSRATRNSEQSLADRAAGHGSLWLFHRFRRPTHTRGYHRQKGWLIPWRRPGNPVVVKEGERRRLAAAARIGRAGNLMTPRRGSFQSPRMREEQ